MENKNSATIASQTPNLQLDPNKHVWVKLDKEGFAWWKEEAERWLPPFQHKDISHYEGKAMNGYVEFQLWDYMFLFGGRMLAGRNCYMLYFNIHDFKTVDNAAGK